MAHEGISRTLWYEGQQGRAELRQAELHDRTEPLIILGEAGMGKSFLLEWLAESPGYSLCTARQFINRPKPQTLLGDAHVLVIDALDEVTAQDEGDAVDQVLRQLGALNYPRFVLSCRVADWHSATAREAIRGQYNSDPLELHLEPFNDDDAIAFLSGRFGPEQAEAIVQHFNTGGLQGLLGNPQTLDLIATVAGTSGLPKTRDELFGRAIDVLRVEHRDTKADRQSAREGALDAAGAAFAALILTGNEVIVRKAAANASEGELQIAEIRRLPGGEAVKAMLDSRLFKADGADRFGYWHRRIGEYLGARWLAKNANTTRKRRRLLSLFHAWGLVPASLRGIHAWLARDPKLALAVIAADPMGVIEYGDTDDLSVEQARGLISTLEKLAAENPRFRDWGPYSVRGILQPELIGDIRRLFTAPATPFSLRLLMLQAIKGSKIATDLASELRALVLQPETIFASRHAAAEALVALGGHEDWPAIVRELHDLGDELSTRLAIEVMDHVDYAPFDDALMVDLVVAHVQHENVTIGVLSRLEKRLPEVRLDGVLDRLAEQAKKLGDPHKRKGNYELTDFTYQLISRRVAEGDVPFVRLWSWLEPFVADYGYRRESRQQFDAMIRQNQALRRGIQRHVLLDLPGDRNIWQRALRLNQRSPGFALTAEDVVALLSVLDPADRRDERWREAVLLARHQDDEGAEVRAAARPFAAHRPDLLEWLDRLAGPRVPEWQVKQAERERKQAAKQAVAWAKHRNIYAGHINTMQEGDYGTVVDPAKAYLDLFHDIGVGVSAHERVSRWLGPEIGEAAHRGFEAFLTRAEPRPTAEQIAESFAQGQHWDAGYIIVAALAERHRNGVGFDGLSDERLMAGLFELHHTKIDSHAGIAGLEEAVEAAVRARGAWTAAMRLYTEPQLQARREHVDSLYALMREDIDSALSADLASEWLERFSDMASGPETEMVGRLIRSGRYDHLRRIAAGRTGLNNNVERRRNWDAVGLIVDFGATVERLETVPIEASLLWHLRDCGGGGRFADGTSVALIAPQLEWMISTFRSLWPFIDFPRGTSSGDTNPWDATDYILRLIQRLGNDLSDDARATLKRLLDAPADGYTATIQVVLAEQARKRVEAAYAPPSLDAINAIARDHAPEGAADLQALMLDELATAQAKIKSDDADSWRGFYDDHKVPFPEDRCRNHLLGLLRQGCEGITLEPETHVGADKEVDIACSVGRLRMPIEIKGQWHRDLWKGIDMQLDPLYTRDWRADGRGIYLVLWFGDQESPNKRLRNPPDDIKRPETPDELREALALGSKAVREARVAIFVLDLTRP